MNLPGVNDIHFPGDVPGCIARAPGAGPHPGVVVLMEAFGLTPHIRNVCARLASLGYTAAAPDLYRGQRFDYADLDGVFAKLRTVDDARAVADVSAALDYLTDTEGAPRCGVSGFCMGGRLAFLAGCRLATRLQAVACFYGGAIAPGVERDRFGRTPPIGETETLQAPLLLVYGGQDPSIAPDEHARVAQRLSTAHKRYTLSVYPGAGHGFCCEDRPSYAATATTSAFKELDGFFAGHLRR
ncbi:MAG TPA: dienelactone hydrolase family protein [Nevskiaceae bacterium]|nr:dienelactone hydrolase family protein [Nevskiaceae bacterium]